MSAIPAGEAAVIDLYGRTVTGGQILQVRIQTLTDSILYCIHG